MIKKVAPLVVALAIAALVIGPGRQFLQSGLRMQTDGALAPGSAPQMDMGEGTPSTIGLAPQPVVNPPAAAARLTVSARPAQKTADGYALAVQITAADGKPLADATVRFYDIVDIFGPREMLLGSDVTDGRGQASYEYLPATGGTHNIVVRFGGRDAVKAGEARTTFDATVTAPAHTAEQRQFSLFTDRIPYAAGALVLAVWALIAFALLATVRGVIDGARTTRGKEGHA